MFSAIIIIQARLGSTRFPGKVLQDLAGKPMLLRQVERVKRAQGVREVVVATSDRPADDRVVELCEKSGIPIFRGSENDVLARFTGAARDACARLDLGSRVKLVRLTGDCPLADPGLIARSLELLDENVDYVGYDSAFPDGMDVESFWLDTLEAADKEARKDSEREHVTPYVWGNPKRFRLKNLATSPGDPNLKHVRLSVDRAEDLELVRKVWDEASRTSVNFGLREIAAAIHAHPEWLALNAGRARNEGYIKSLREDQMKEFPKRNLAKSEEWWARAVKRIPNGTQTLSKSPTQFIGGVYPKYLERGEGAHVWDVDGNRYIDYPMSLGAILLGHAHPAVVEAVTKAARDGNLFTLMHPLEVRLAERLCEMIPCAEMVRFAKNGADATSGAVRVARALTGREHVAYCGYHGYQDWYASIHPMPKGVPAYARPLMHEFAYNNLASLEKVFSENKRKIACVIMEQPGVEPQDRFLQKCIDLAHSNGALFVLDEIVTGFRYAKGGAQERYGIKPDLACFGKAMANGFPISAVVGKRDVMKEFENVFFSTTFGGETTALAAALAVTDVMLKEDVIGHLRSLGQYWMDSFNKLKDSLGGVNVKLMGCAPRTSFEFRDAKGEVSGDIRSLFLQETCKRGILFGVPIFMTYSHARADIDLTLDACEAALKICRKAIEDESIDAFMEGTKIGPIFRPQPKV